MTPHGAGRPNGSDDGPGDGGRDGSDDVTGDGADGPEAIDPVAVRLFALLVRRSRGATDLVEDLLGRPVRARVMAQDEILRIEPPGLVRLQTTGPVVHRHVLLSDSLPPHLPVAVAWALIVPWRLPADVRAALRHTDEPLDRLLGRYRVAWLTEPLDATTETAGAASTVFPWTSPDAPLVEQTRLVLLDSVIPVAATIEEVPFLPPREDPLAPLMPLPSRADVHDGCA